jgi:hypothetical protein
MSRLVAVVFVMLGALVPATDPAGSLPLHSRLDAASVPVVAAAGDIVCQSNTPSPTECRHRQTSDLLVGRGFDAVLPLGDLQYNTGSLSAFQTYYDPTWGRVKGITHPVPGNHEYLTAGAAGYFAYFGSAAGDPAKGYYSFDLGAWHLIALNSNCGAVGGCHAGSAQERWLRADLAAHQAVCTLAYWHHPRFTSGSVHESDVAMRPFWQALYDQGADVVLSGHQHNYERYAPQTPAGDRDDAKGVLQFVVGTGGRSLYPFGPPQRNSIVRSDTAFGVLTMTLHPTWFGWAFLSETGATIDSGSAACSGQAGIGRLSVDLEGKPGKVDRPGRRVRLRATVAPCVPPGHGEVAFQRRRLGTWRTMDTVATDDSCVASIKRRVRRTTRYRAVFPAADAISAVFKIRVMR